MDNLGSFQGVSELDPELSTRSLSQNGSSIHLILWGSSPFVYMCLCTLFSNTGISPTGGSVGYMSDGELVYGLSVKTVDESPFVRWVTK